MKWNEMEWNGIANGSGMESRTVAEWNRER